MSDGIGAAVSDAAAAPVAKVRISANLLLLAASLAACAVILECAARLLLPAPLPWRYPQLRYRSDPATIFSLQPNQEAFSADKPVAINARGLRGPLVPYERTPGVERLLVIGDSIVFGYGVADPDVLTQRIVERSRGAGAAAEAINFGVPAYNTEQEINSLARDGLRYHPDWVIVGVCWNDVSDKSEVQVSADGWLVSPGSDADGGWPAIAESSFGYELRNALKQSRLLFGSLEGGRALLGRLRPDRLALLRTDVLEGRDSADVSAGWERVAAALHRFGQLSAAHGFRPLIVAYPLPLALERSYPDSSYPRQLQAISDREGIPMIDLQPIFRPAFSGHESLFIPFDSDHPNAAGHDLAARAIVDFITAPSGNSAHDRQ